MNTKRKAVEIITGVYRDSDYASLSMQNVNDEYVNMGLLTTIVYGTLRNQRLVREGWQVFVKDELSNDINALMDVGVYMLSYIDNVPDYAVVNDLVELSKEIEHGKYTNLVNAVLKKFNRQGSLDIKVTDNATLARRTSFPEWLVNMLVAHYGFDRVKEFCFYSLEEADVALRINTSLITKKEIMNDSKFNEGQLVPDAVYYDGNILRTRYFKDDVISIQDEASQTVAYRVDAFENDKVLDMCSAPGTKAAHLALLREDKGHIDALDIHQHRVDLINKMLDRLNLKSIQTYVYDATKVSDILKQEDYDRVLIDAPCSGLGVLRQKPEIKYTIKPEDIDDLEILQQKLLKEGSKMLKSGGRLIYSTCTFNKKENERQIKRFLEHHDDFELIQEENIFGPEFKTDTFYIAVLRKR